LEPLFNVALEGASFINASSRGEARRLAGKLPHPSDKLDEQTSRLIAVSQGIGAVVTGSLSHRGDGYKISVEVLDSTSGNTLAAADVMVSNKDEVVQAIPKLAAPIRKALGDNTPESVQLNEVSGGFTAASLEAVHQQAIGMEQQFAGKFEEALQSFSKAAELDPNFARAYSGMAAIADNLDRQKDAEKYIALAMQHEDRMTERERYRNRGLFYLTTGNWQKCVEECSQLVNRYPADRVGQVNLASCLAQLRDLPKAVEAARRAVEIVPKGAIQRLNLSFLSSASGDFQTGEKEARAALQLNLSSEVGYLQLGEAQIGQGQLTQGTENYQQLEKVSSLGSSMAATALADLALYEGRLEDAVRMLEQGAAADLASKNPEAAANKFAALAYTQLWRQQKGPAVRAAEKALANSHAVNIRFLTARIFVEAGEVAKAQKLAASLGSDLQAEPQAYAQIIEGKLALRRGDVAGAIKVLTDANRLLDTWIGRFELGRAYLQAGAFVEADSEFDRCIKRQGEALELFMDDVPTYGYFPSVYYYQGRVREGLKNPESVSSYRTYLSIRDKAGEDPLLAEVRKRAGQ
ncbi:MAG: tetratricopeptide repeat protein, partial [Terriglobales bacterium]